MTATAEVIAQLKEVLAQMTPGPWSPLVTTSEYGARAACGPWHLCGADGSAHERAYADATGIVALRNYADRLLAVAEAAAAYREAQRQLAVARASASHTLAEDKRLLHIFEETRDALDVALAALVEGA